MRFGLIGLLVGSLSVDNSRKRRSGFTLLEALVALTLVAIFTAVLGHFLLQARSIVSDAGTRIAAQDLLRSLLDNPLPRPTLTRSWQAGESNGLRWRLVTQPFAALPRDRTERSIWIPFRVTASVSWASGPTVTAETVRLGRLE